MGSNGPLDRLAVVLCTAVVGYGPRPLTILVQIHAGWDNCFVDLLPEFTLRGSQTGADVEASASASSSGVSGKAVLRDYTCRVRNSMRDIHEAPRPGLWDMQPHSDKRT
jgi:hypothetical protein